MTQGFQRFTKRYVNVLGILIGLTVAGLILFYSGCGMTGSPTPPASRTPTPTPAPDTVRPTSTITSPSAGAIVKTGTFVPITGTASDAGGGTVQSVQVSLDGGVTWNTATGTNAWMGDWSPALSGPVTIKSRAIDNSGNVQDPPAEITVTVQDNTRPTSAILLPVAGGIVSVTTAGTVNAVGLARDGGGGSVAKVEVSVDGGVTWDTATGTSEWSYDWMPAVSGPATVKSRAVDDSGNVQDPPAEVAFTIQDSTRPTSTITSPASGVIILTGTTVSITGTASDTAPGSVARVDVSVDGGATYNAATGTTSWSYMWTPTTPGRVTILSQAVDDSGNVQFPQAEITVTVPIRVPSDQPTIQSAIDVATHGGMVLVAPGTYPENINFKGKAITVRSESGPEATIIDGGNADSVATFTSGEGRNSTLDGFTLQNGRENPNSFDRGGGVTIRSSSPTITNNVIRNNQACSGGGITIRFGSALIQRNTITGNNNNACIGGGGGGIYIEGPSSAEILDNVISDNGMGSDRFSTSGGGIYMFLRAGGTPVVKRNIIRGNVVDNVFEGQGGGICLVGVSGALIVQNLITGNRAYVGGGIYSTALGPVLINNTIADNNAISNGSGIFASGANGQTELTNNIIVPKPGQFGLYCGSINGQDPPIIRFNNIFSSDGMAYGGACSDKTGSDGNLSVDPMFANPTQGDFHLQQGSPSIDSGFNLTPNLPDTDIDGDPRILDGDGNETAIVDMGVDEFLLSPGLKISLLDESGGNMLKIKWLVSGYSMRGNHPWRRRKPDIERQFGYFPRLRR